MFYTEVEFTARYPIMNTQYAFPNAIPGKPNEQPLPVKVPEVVPAPEPKPEVWPQTEPEVLPGQEPLTVPPKSPPEIPDKPEPSTQRSL